MSLTRFSYQMQSKTFTAGDLSGCGLGVDLDLDLDLGKPNIK